MKLVRSLRSLMLVSCMGAMPVLTTLASLPLATPVLAQPLAQSEMLMRTLSVTGRGKQAIATTLTQVQLGVEAQGQTAAEVQQEVGQKSSAVVSFLRSRNVDKLQTTGIFLSPQYDYSNNRQRIIGYTATNTVSFQIPTATAGDILDQSVQAGATRIDGVNFIADDAAITAARQQAIRQAVQDAQAQAEAAFAALGVSQQEVIGVQIDGAGTPPPIVRPFEAARMAAPAPADAAMPVVGGEQEVTASVTLQIRY